MNVVEINKYRPSLFRHARYLSQDWTAISQLGETWNGTALSFSLYLETEDRYVRAVLRFLHGAGIDRLRVQGFEHWTADTELDTQTATGLVPRPAPRDGDEVDETTIADLVRRCLRDVAWMELAIPHEFLLHVNHDYRLIIATTAPTAEAEEATRADGLFTYPGDHGIATLRQWEADRVARS